MKKLIFIIFLLSYSAVYSQTKTINNTIVIKFKNTAHKGITNKEETVKNILKSDFIKISPMFPYHQKQSAKGNYTLSNIYTIQTKGNKDIYNYLYELEKSDQIEYACPYFIPELLGEAPDDIHINKQYHLELTKTFEAHEIEYGDSCIIVGVVDAGIEILHEDLKSNIKYNYADPINGIDDDNDGFTDNYYGWDFGDNDNNPNPHKYHHGTMVAGLVAATGKNGKGIYGIGGNTKMLAVKIDDKDGNLTGAYQGIVYAADQGCDVINCSWGSPIKNPLCDDVVNYAIKEKNSLIISAAGNDKNNIPYYPAACNGVLNVAATNSSDIKWAGSTYGLEVDITAPGENVYTTTINNSYTHGWGTSFASPIVAGCAALVKAHKPDFTPLQIAEQLRITADIIDTIPENKFYRHRMGSGRLNALNALTTDSLPSLRISNLICSGKNNVPQSGDTLNVSFDVTNYLQQVSNTIIRLSINTEYGKSENNFLSTGLIGTMQTINNSNLPMQLILNSELNYDEIVEFDFDFASKNYKDFQAFKILVNQSFVNVRNTYLHSSFTSNGTIGFANANKLLGKGIVYKSKENILAESGIIIGNSKTNVLSALPKDMEFGISTVVDTVAHKNYIEGNSVFYPNNIAKDMPIEINQKSKMYYDDEYFGKMIFHEYTVINKGAVDIKDFAFSIYTDWDLDNIYANSVEYDEERNLLMSISKSTNNIFAGISLINYNKSTPYVFDLGKNGNGGIDITNDFTDEKKWFAMNNSRATDNNTELNINTSFMLTAPKQTLKYADSLKYIVAIAVADTYMEIVKNTSKARDLYNKTSEATHIQQKTNDFIISPNPTSDIIQINLPESIKHCICSIYNTYGQIVLNKQIQKNNFYLNVSDFTNGIYIIKINTEKGIFTDKIKVQ